jgi:hypothetical protein
MENLTGGLNNYGEKKILKYHRRQVYEDDINRLIDKVTGKSPNDPISPEQVRGRYKKAKKGRKEI